MKMTVTRGSIIETAIGAIVSLAAGVLLARYGRLLSNLSYHSWRLSAARYPPDAIRARFPGYLLRPTYHRAMTLIAAVAAFLTSAFLWLHLFEGLRVIDLHGWTMAPPRPVPRGPRIHTPMDIAITLIGAGFAWYLAGYLIANRAELGRRTQQAWRAATSEREGSPPSEVSPRAVAFIVAASILDTVFGAVWLWSGLR
jgi:hypothetical protein